MHKIMTEFKKFKGKNFKDILKFYRDNNNETFYEDIYFYYIYYKQLNNNKEGKYTTAFLKKNKNKNLKSEKQLLRKKCKKYDINEKKILVKIMKIFDDINEKEKLKTFKYKGYLNLGYDILNNRYYFNNLYGKSIEYIKQCPICNQNKKNLYKKPGVIQIIRKARKDIYQIDITLIPKN